MSVKAALVTDQQDLIRILRLRIKVFILEQKVPVEEELDVHDETADHFIATDGDVVVGAARLAQIDGVWKLGRMAVAAEARKRGVGRLLVETLEARARERGVEAIKLSAQVQAIGFYERLGYEVYGETSMDAGIPHREMSKDLGHEVPVAP